MPHPLHKNLHTTTNKQHGCVGEAAQSVRRAAGGAVLLHAGELCAAAAAGPYEYLIGCMTTIVILTLKVPSLRAVCWGGHQPGSARRLSRR